VYIYGHHDNNHRSNSGNHHHFYDSAASIMFSPLSFTALGETMLYTSPNWWESSWSPTVARDLMLRNFGRVLTRLFLYRYALRFLMTTCLMRLPRYTSCKHTGAAQSGDGCIADPLSPFTSISNRLQIIPLFAAIPRILAI
jgi:hypothetical protein